METPAQTPRQMTPAEYEYHRDEGNLKALAIGTAAYGAFQLLAAVVQVFFMNQMMSMMKMPTVGAPQDARAAFAMFESVMQGALIVSLVLMGGNGLLALIAAKCIQDRKGWTLIMISAGFNCINVPIGTVLGVFQFILLSKPHIKARFNREQPMAR